MRERGPPTGGDDRARDTRGARSIASGPPLLTKKKGGPGEAIFARRHSPQILPDMGRGRSQEHGRKRPDRKEFQMSKTKKRANPNPATAPEL